VARFVFGDGNEAACDVGVRAVLRRPAREGGGSPLSKATLDERLAGQGCEVAAGFPNGADVERPRSLPSAPIHARKSKTELCMPDLVERGMVCSLHEFGWCAECEELRGDTGEGCDGGVLGEGVVEPLGSECAACWLVEGVHLRGKFVDPCVP